MSDLTKTVVQVYNCKEYNSVDRIWADPNTLKYKDFGITCTERSNPSTIMFIPYTSIRMITFPKNKKA